MDDLGPELLAKILQLGRFSPSELCHFSMLNRDWREAVAARELWMQMELQVPDYSQSLLQRIAKSCHDLSDLTVSRSPRHPRALTITFW